VSQPHQQAVALSALQADPSASFHASIIAPETVRQSEKPDCCTAGNLLQAESELDAVIRELGAASTQAMFNGAPDTVREFSRRMYAAIRSRTPQHQARLQAEREARIADELSFHGEWTQEVMGRRTA
jgi:hypothetical protein